MCRAFLFLFFRYRDEFFYAVRPGLMSVGNCFGSSNPKFVVCLASMLGRLLFVSGLPCLIGFGLGRSKNFFKFSEAIPRERRFHRTKSQAMQKFFKHIILFFLDIGMNFSR